MAGEAADRPSAGLYALYPVRIGLALVFIVYGWNKWTDLAGVEAMFDGWGIPAPGVAVVLVATAELLGGLGILLGVLSRFSAGVLSVVMLTAIVQVRYGTGFVGGWDLEVALLAGLLTVVVNGPGRPTLLSVLDLEHLDPEAWLWEQLRGQRSGPAEAV